ncbi:erythromycin esterase family protein [Deinococcus yavapaiensis]|uniref:Erythromycin esterase-like protein n=1 Tax=Deinococcus yavapaiensis KR-236 TaxID=694435 RepID=A0A318S6G0_9DEIO|nr:erythromycin esterase family protein [Deinococcus yavapaiensis]PYE53239.1 erythromycin esterase-like protein [Deinococcus yavapaiensis KR-236]
MNLKLLLLGASLLFPVAFAVGGAQPPPSTSTDLAASLRSVARSVSDDLRTLEPIVQLAKDARLVLIGEGTHGTHEFYRTRAELTKRLVQEYGFDAVVIEGDWPDAQRVNRFVRLEGADTTPEQALSNFTRFPRWLWRNTVVRDFVGWLRATNVTRASSDRTSFYGMDLYSLPASRLEVLRLLGTLDTASAERARARYACLALIGTPLQDDPGTPETSNGASCTRNAADVFADVLRLTAQRRARLDASREALFDLEQNARIVKNAVAYERAALDVFGASSSWNVRDSHMFETLEAIRAHLGATSKIVVWAHNSHLGDARATEMGRSGEHNVGQLVRQRYGAGALLVGFTTHTGTVTAAEEWDGPPRTMQIRPSLESSYERLFHDTGLARFMLESKRAPLALRQERLERAIGVQYLPATERLSHYFSVNLPAQFDVVVHFDVTRALEPLDSAGR